MSRSSDNTLSLYLQLMVTREVYKLRAGSIKRLKISEETLPKPDLSEVQVKIRAIGLNFADVFAILGLYSATPKGDFIPGLEFCGEVLAVGAEVKSFKVGDRIMGVTRFGAYTSHLNIDHRYVMHLPKDWSYEDGASYLVQVLTAYYGLTSLGNLKKGHTVLIHSAAGGVGLWANRICKKIGAYTIGTVGHERKLTLLESENYNAGIVRDQKDFENGLIDKLENRRLDIIMECIGGKIMKIGYKLLGPMGRQVVYGSAHYGGTFDRPNYFSLIPKYLTRPRIDPQNMIKENKSIMAFNLIYLFENVDLMHDLLKQLETLHLGKPVIGHSFPFEKLPDAVRLFRDGLTIGKVVVTV